MEHNEEAVVVFRDKKERKIETYVRLSGHGARVELGEFIAMMAEAYGNPTLTFTVGGHEHALKVAALEVIQKMKASTREVAAINLEPPLPEK